MISPETLRRYPIFGVFNDDQLRSIAMITEEEPVEKGVVLFNEGDLATTLYLLIDGGVDLYHVVQEQVRPENKKEYLVGEINPGELFGLSTVISPFRYITLARPSITSCVLRIDGSKIRAAIEQDPVLGYKLIHKVAKQLVERLNTTRSQLAAAWT